jgi:hypothetical protein
MFNTANVERMKLCIPGVNADKTSTLVTDRSNTTSLLENSVKINVVSEIRSNSLARKATLATVSVAVADLINTFSFSAIVSMFIMSNAVRIPLNDRDASSEISISSGKDLTDAINRLVISARLSAIIFNLINTPLLTVIAIKLIAPEVFLMML